MSNAALAGFFTSKHFAVAGASTNPSKFGNKVLRWYKQRELDVTPLNPKEPEVEGLKTLPDVNALPSPASTSVSFVTPPPATLSLLQSTFDGSDPIAYAWLQPGAEDRAVVEWVREHKLDDRIVFGGPCVLVLGDKFREQAKL